MIDPPARLGENAPGGYNSQWLCITGPRYSTVAASPFHDEKADRPTTPPPKPSAPEGKLFLTKAAEIIGCKASYLPEMCKLGKIPCERVGRFVFLRTEDVQRYRAGSRERKRQASSANLARARAAHYKLPPNENLGGMAASERA